VHLDPEFLTHGCTLFLLTLHAFVTVEWIFFKLTDCVATGIGHAEAIGSPEGRPTCKQIDLIMVDTPGCARESTNVMLYLSCTYSDVIGD